MKKRYFGQFGGRYIPEVLFPAFEELERAYARYHEDSDFWKENFDVDPVMPDVASPLPTPMPSSQPSRTRPVSSMERRQPTG